MIRKLIVRATPRRSVVHVLVNATLVYSLGIVFFEMWHPFDTSHERVYVLQRLRLQSGDLAHSFPSSQNSSAILGPAFPEGFPESHPRQSQIIRWLLQVCFVYFSLNRL
jgi:hypothetical protein